MVGVVVTMALWGAGIAWFVVDRGSFLLAAHALAAGVVFLPMAAVALLAGVAALRGGTGASKQYGLAQRRELVPADPAL